MTYGSEERWEPVLGDGLPASGAPVETTFLHPDDLAALDAYLAAKAARPPIGFAPKEIHP